MNAPCRLCSLSPLAVALCAGAASPLDPSVAPPRVTWIVHVDVEAMQASETGRFILANKQMLDIDADDLEEMNRILQLDMERDLKGFTVYNGPEGGEDDAIAVATFSAEVEKQAERLAKEAPTFKKVVDGDFTYFSWVDKDEVRCAAILPSRAGAGLRSVVIAADAPSLREAAAVVSGKSPSIGADSPLLARKPAPGSVIFATASEFPRGDEDDMARVLQQAQGGAVDIGEANGEVFGDIIVRAGEAKAAADIAQVGNGLMALGRMMGAEDPATKPMANLLSAITITVEGSNVVVKGRYPAVKAVEAMREMAKAREADEGDDGEHHGHHGKEGRKGNHGGGKPKY